MTTLNDKQQKMATFNTVTAHPPTPQPVEVRWLHMSTEQKIETPCPSKFCQNVFKCGFNHTMKECADAYDRRQAEAQVEQERAVRKDQYQFKFLPIPGKMTK